MLSKIGDNKLFRRSTHPWSPSSTSVTMYRATHTIEPIGFYCGEFPQYYSLGLIVWLPHDRRCLVLLCGLDLIVQTLGILCRLSVMGSTWDNLQCSLIHWPRTIADENELPFKLNLNYATLKEGGISRAYGRDLEALLTHLHIFNTRPWRYHSSNTRTRALRDIFREGDMKEP